jgi:thioredoxin-like negative regulator of GroEL
MNQPTEATSTAVEALLLVAPGCPHCAGVLEGLGTLIKEGALGRLEVVNIAVQPALARELGVRAVPWMRIGPFDLSGLHTAAELRHWADLAGREDGMTHYLADLLASGRRAQVAARVEQDPALLPRLVDLLGDPGSGLSVRIGVMATLEELRETGSLLEGLGDRLAPLTRHQEPRIRADACHALSLTGAPGVLNLIRPCLDDPDPEVRETAADSLQAMEQAASRP